LFICIKPNVVAAGIAKVAVTGAAAAPVLKALNIPDVFGILL